MTIFELPPGYGPEQVENQGTVSNGQIGYVKIISSGPVFSEGGGGSSFETNAKQWLSLDGISFRCAPSGQNGCP